MSSLTIRLPEKVLKEVDKRGQSLHMSRTIYIRKYIEAMNTSIQENERKNRLAEVSKRVRKESMSVNLEFARIENEPKA